MLNRFYKNQRGASSILVIILMVVLLVFGLAVLTTTLSNVRLGESKRAWLQDYYTLEALGEEQIAFYDTLLLEAALEARDRVSHVTTAESDSQFYKMAYTNIYMELVNDKLYNLMDDSENIILTWLDPDPSAYMPMALTFSVELPDSDYSKYLQITMGILGAYDDNLSDDLVFNERYVLTRHTQQQSTYLLDESIEFDDPFEEDSTSDNPFDE